MKILHVGDRAGVAGCLAKFQRKLGHFVELVGPEYDYMDGLRQKSFYNLRVVSPVFRRFARFGFVGDLFRFVQRKVALLVYYVVVGWYSRNFDFVHVHSDWKVALFIRKPKLVEFHGSELRGFPVVVGKRERLLTKLFLRVFGGKYRFAVSTPDLQKLLPQALYLPNPVDTDHFKKDSIGVSNHSNKALYFKNKYESSDRAMILADVKGLSLCILERGKDHVDFADMPKFLSLFKYFIDRHEIKSLSKTALEALWVGCKVIDYKGQILEGLPREHEPLLVALHSEVYYNWILGGCF